MSVVEQFSLESGRSDRRPPTLVSSIGGFSESVYKTIRSLHDLLTAIQPLKLDVFEGSSFDETVQAGEGASYRVKKCVHRPSKQVVAIKQVKLPPYSTHLDAFHSRVGCVLRDIEVMSHPPLAECKHILNLLGYGWRLHHESIPFLVTEYASYGTLRQFLRSRQSSLPGFQKLQLCRDVSAGLEELHLAGVVHGDLKLDNILVLPNVETTEEGDRSAEVTALPVVVKLADFGYSLLLQHTDQHVDEQRYNGTELYNPPEVSLQAHIDWGSLNFRKCDIWALGLLCWEVMLDGQPYYEDLRIRNFLQALTSQSSYSSVTASANTTGSSHSSADDVTCNLAEVQKSLGSLAEDFADTHLRRILRGTLSRTLLRSLFAGSMKADPVERVEDVGRLPLKCGVSTTIIPPRTQLADTASVLSEWTFENFQPVRFMGIPHAAKEQMFKDFKHVVSARTKDPDAGKASLQVAIALSVGFGVDQDLEGFATWLQKSSMHGLKTGSIILSWFQRHSESLDSEADPLNSFLLLFRSVVKYAVSYGRIMTATNETGIEAACLMGDLDELIRLLNPGTAPHFPLTKDEIIYPLRWLFMFDKDGIDRIVKRLKLHLRNETAIVWKMYDTSKQEARVLDPQLPLEVVASPLLNATSAASLPAVEALLKLGANPLKEYTIGGLQITPLQLAASLHLYQIFKRFLEHCKNTETLQNLLIGRLPIDSDPSTSWNAKSSPNQVRQALATSSLFHRFLIHGHHASRARGDMVEYFLRESGPLQIRPQSSESSSQDLLENATLLGDFDLVRTWVKAASWTVLPDQEHTVIWGASDKARLMNAAVEIATREVFPWKNGLDMIEYATSIGCDLDTNVPGLRLPQPIHTIINKHQEQLFCWMLEQRFDPNARDPEGKTCLHHMINSGFSNLARFKALLDLGAEPYAPDNHGVTPIYLAIEQGCGVELGAMLQQHPTLEADLEGDTALHYVAKLGNAELLGKISSLMASNVDLANKEGQTPLLVAAYSGNAEMVRYLVAVGANTTLCDRSGRSWLHLAASNGNPETMKTIFRSLGAQLGSRLTLDDMNGDTPLVSGCRSVGSGREHERMICCQQLLEAGSSPHKPLHVAVEKGNTQLVSLILTFRPNPKYECNALNPKWLNATCLSKAAFYGNLLVVELLLKAHGALGLDSRNRTCLHYAILGGSKLLQKSRSLEMRAYFNLLTILVDYLFGMEPGLIDAQDDKGRTALHVALLSNQTVLPSFLYLFRERTKKRIQVDIHSKDMYGHTPLHLATVTGELRVSLVHQMLYEFVGATAHEIIEVSQLAISLEAVPKVLVCLFVSSGAEAFDSTTDCACPFELTMTALPMHERNILRGLMLLHARKKNGKAHASIDSLNPRQLDILSESLINAACYSSHDDARPIRSAFSLWTATKGDTVDLQLDLGNGATWKAFVELLDGVGEPLFLEHDANSGVPYPIPVISKVLAAKPCNTALAICLLSLHAKAALHQSSNQVPNHLNLGTKEVSVQNGHEHDDAITLTWNRAWTECHWDLVESFVCLGLEVSGQSPRVARSHHPQHKDLEGLFRYAFKNQRSFLATVLTGETIDFSGAPNIWQVDNDSPDHGVSTSICSLLIKQSPAPNMHWLQTAKSFWKESTTFPFRLQERFPDHYLQIKGALNRALAEDIEERVQLHMKSLPRPGHEYQSIRRQQFLRAIVEELFSIFIILPFGEKKEIVSRLIDDMLKLGAAEDMKPYPLEQLSLYEPHTMRAKLSLGFYVAHDSSEKRRRKTKGYRWATYSPGMLFYIIGDPFKEIQTEQPAWLAMRVHYKEGGVVLVERRHFEQETTCLKWRDDFPG